MATAGPDKKYRTWPVNDKFKVSVNKENPDYTKAKVQFQCFITTKDNVEIKAEVRPGKTIVQLPIPQSNNSHSRDTLKAIFRKCMISFVIKDKSYVLIPLDNINVNYWTKREFCEVILEEFIALAENQKMKHDHPVKLEFCTMEDHNFGEAVKACDAKIKEVKSIPVVQKDSRSHGPSVCIVKGSLANVKVDGIACTTAHNFDLSHGAVSAALLRQGGSGLQRELNKKCGGAQNYGEVIPVSGHKLDCSMVFFGVMYPYDPKYAKGYKTAEEYYHISIHEFVQRCLNLAEQKHIRSVAFPAIGAGVLKYPIHVVADQMFKTVNDWRGTYVKEVKFVIYPKDMTVLQEFEQALKKYGASTVPSSEIRHSGSMRTSQFNIPNPDSQVGSSKVKCRFPLPKGYTTEFIEMCCADVIDRLKKSDCDVSFTKDELIIKFASEVCAIGKSEITDALMNMQKEYPTYDFLDLTQTNYNQNEVRKKVEEIEKSSKVKCSVSNNGTSVSFFGKIVQDVKDAKNRFFSFLLPPKGHSEENSQKNTKDAGSNIKTPGFSRQFSWSTRAKALYVFETKEKITVKVYSSDILCVPVDCIVNAANVDLKHGGGIARAIAEAAGKDLTKEGRDYLKHHGKLRVGEVCHTGAGKMSYNYVIHAVGPCWSDYKPYSKRDVERCETDLYNAVINSLSEAEKLNMETIAVSSISSGIYGCPLDLCSIQYAKAVVDYSSCAKSPLKEIHFVDTNMEMVQIMHKTFQSMVPDEHIPKSYNKMRYVKSAATYSKDRKLSPRNQDQLPDDDCNRFGKGKSGLVIYPYCHRDTPPGHSKKEFACCIGPGQNLYIYTVDILSMTSKDMIACGNTPTGETKGYLANAIKKRGGNVYKAEMTKTFVPKPKEGDVVVCKSNLPNFKWVAHAILHKKIHCSKDDREFKVTSSLFKIFHAMKSYSCHSIALPLVGTGKGNADPVFYGERFFEALCEFSAYHKEYGFKVHLVHYDKKSTEKAIETINKACRDTRPLQIITNRQKFDTGYTRGENGARPKSAGPNVFGNHGRDTSSDKHEQNKRHSSYMKPSKNWNQSRNEKLQEHRRRNKKERVEGLNFDSSTTGMFKGRQSEYDRDLDCVVEKPKADKDDIDERESDDSSIKTDEERENGPNESENGPNESACSETIPGSADERLAVNSNLSKEIKGNLKIFEETKDKQENKSTGTFSSKIFGDAKENNVAKPIGMEDSFDKTDDDEEDVVDDVHVDDDDEEEVYDDAPSEIVPDEEEDNGEEEVETCVICMDDISNPKTLSCGHVFCTECIEAQFTYKEACPTCGKVCGIITGDQPSGDMDVFVNNRASCAGFEGCGRIEITYKFPDGTQGPTHPRPNARFKGITRKAYLPNNRRGQEICEMLKVAFERKLVFTIGNSRTTGAEGVITWNDIHHKTDQKPNTQFGYPDPTYLDRVTDELKIKGVTVDDIPTLSAHRSRRR